MSWMTWVAILIAWPLVGLVVACLFGRFTHQSEFEGSAAELLPPGVSYLRRAKRVRGASRSPLAQPKVRREATGGPRVH
jgi:hypothetical protein